MSDMSIMAVLIVVLIATAYLLRFLSLWTVKKVIELRDKREES